MHDDEAFIKALLEQHPRAADKTKGGIKRIRVGQPEEHPTSNCFYVVRNDDTEEDFSYHKCIDEVFPALTEKGMKRSRDSKDRDGKRPRTEPEKEEVQYTPGLVVIMEGAKAELASAKAMRQELSTYGDVKFVDVVEDKCLVYIRFAEASAVERVLEELKEWDGEQVTLSVMTGDQEKEYYEKIAAAGKLKHGGGRGGGRGGRGGRGGPGRHRGRGGGQWRGKRAPW